MLGHFVAGEKVGHFVVLGQFVASKASETMVFYESISGTFCRRGGNGTFCRWDNLSHGEKMPVGEFVVGTKCLLTENENKHNK